jgi:hypothetical protein
LVTRKFLQINRVTRVYRARVLAALTKQLARRFCRHTIRLRLPTAAIDNRFVEYLLELSEGVTGRISKRQSAITSRGSSRLPTKDRESRKEPQ